MSPPSSPQSEDLLSSWLAALRQGGKRAATIAAYRRALEHFMAWFELISHHPFAPEEVTPRDVQDWMTSQQRRERAAPATINQRLVALSRFFQWAAQQGRMVELPTATIVGLEVPKRRPESLDPDQLLSLLRAARHHVRDYALLAVLVGTGIQVSELLVMRIGDMVFGKSEGTLRARNNDGATRVVPLPPNLCRALKDYLDTHPDRNNPDAAVWLGTQGALSHRSSVLRILDKYALRADIDKVTLEMLRHTFAQFYLVSNPGDLRGLARLLGHTNLATVKLYVESDDGE